MKFVKVVYERGGTSIDLRAYESYLEANKPLFPAGVAKLCFPVKKYFHWDSVDFRHDARIERIAMSETAADRPGVSSLSISMKTILASGVVLELNYLQPSRYVIRKRRTDWPKGSTGHGLVVCDEIRLSSEQGYVIHEILFQDARIIIEAKDVLGTEHKLSTDQANT
jgi:hypothetical protein